MEQMDVRVAFYLKKSETNADGCCPVMARLTVGNHSEAAFSAKMSVPVSSWESGRATGKSAATREINRKLDELRASALAIYKEQSAIREVVTAEEVRDLLLGKASGQTTLLSYFQTFIEHFEKRVGVNREKDTLRSYRYARNCVSAFLQTQYKLSDIPFAALDRSFIDRYDLYLRTERRIAPGTIVLLTTKLNTIVGEAVAEGIITADPFAGYEPKRPERVQKYLTADELHRLMTTPLHHPTLYQTRDLFLFSCYTGIPYGDMCRLSGRDVSGNCRGRRGVDQNHAQEDEDRLRTAAARYSPPYSRQIQGYRAGREITSYVRQHYTQPGSETYRSRSAVSKSGSFSTADGIPTPPKSRFRRAFRWKRSVRCWATHVSTRHRFMPK